MPSQGSRRLVSSKRGSGAVLDRAGAAEHMNDLNSCSGRNRQLPSDQHAAPLPARLRGTLANSAVLRERATARGASHVLPLNRLVAALRERHGVVPDVDPFDGGIAARLLLLLETPAPGAEPLRFVSRDNATGTGANLRRFFAAAGIARPDTLIWNAVPQVIHATGARNRAPRRAEVAAGLAELPRLLALLPRLAVAVLAGRVAAEARSPIEAMLPGLPVLEIPHPSPTFVCTSPAVPATITRALAQAAAVLAASPP